MAISVIVYSYSKCSTCRKALSWLEKHKIAYEVIDIVTSPPAKEVLVQAFNQIGNRKYLFNTSGLSYRALGAAKVKTMSDDEVFDALAEDGKLIKRPFLIFSGDKFLVGFNEKTWSQFFLD